VTLQTTRVRPTSFAQRRLWFLEQLVPGQPWYDIVVGLRLRGTLNVAALERAVQEVARRHEVLRTTFSATDGTPVQVVAATVTVPFDVVDLTHLDAPERQRALDAVVTAESRRVFDLERGPLLWTRLVALAPDEHVLLLSTHHIVSDGWSVGILLDELGQLYTAFREGRPSPLPELPIQYGDFVEWQHEAVRGESHARKLAYWRRKLANAPAVMELPLDHPRPAVVSQRGANLAHHLPLGLREALTALARGERVTLFMALLAGFVALLHRSSGASDLVVGSPIAGRTRQEHERLIGLFVNMLPLRMDVSDDPTFRELLVRARTVMLEAFSNQEVPFEHLVDELRPERSTSHTPLFQVTFAFQNTPGGGLSLPGLQATPFEPPGEVAKTDLAVFAWEDADGMTTAFQYSTDLFEESTIARLAQRYATLLHAVAAQPDLRLSRIPVLDAAETRLLLHDWNATDAPPPRARLVHELVQPHAARAPESTAVIGPASSLTYGELHRRASQLAHRLRALGVSRGSPVALCLERTPDLVVAMLAVLESGGAFVPLDPDYPPDRLAYMLEDADPVVLVTQGSLADRLPPTSAHRVALDAEAEVLAALPETPPRVDLAPDDLAYVIYTSGSTGRPKGVMCTHRGLVNLVTWYGRAYSLTPEDRLTQVVAVSFDGAVWEVFSCLAAGATLHIADAALRTEPGQLLAWLATERINVSLLPTPLAEAVLNLVETWHVDGLPLRALVTGGDRLRRRPPEWGPPTYNHYGPTEDTVCSTAVPVLPGGDGPPSIGRGIDNHRMYVLDRDLRLVPAGVPGELFIAGTGISRGYLRRPDLTADRFIPNPFAGGTGDRMYRTGDLCRWSHDGQLLFLDRIDDQVKVRGFRLELGEIETVLAQHPGVDEAAVVAAPDRHGETRLVAYVVPAAEPPPTAAELRAHLSGSLPPPMVPALYVHLDALPLTPNGKIDRRSLPAPDGIAQAARTDAVAPRTPTERIVADTWAEVLGLEQVGVSDDFFELGGHSFAALSASSRMTQALGMRVSVAAIFQARTVERLAAGLDAREHEDARSPLVTLRAGGSGTPLFLVHPVGGNVLCYADVVRHLRPDRPVYGLVSPGLDGSTPPLTSIEALAEHHVDALLTAGHRGPFVLGGWSLGGVVAFEMARILRARGGGDVAALLLVDSRTAELGEAAEESAVLAWFADDWGQSMGRDLGVRREDLAALPPERRLEHVARRAVEAGALPRDAGADVIRGPVGVFWANARALGEYRPSEPHRGRVVVVRAAGGPDDGSGPLLGWGRWAADVEAVAVPGDHYEIVREPGARGLAEAITEALATT
jgi:amino acid adenylation domain-containing protein